MLGRLDQIHKHNIKVAPSVCTNFGEPYRPFLYWLTNDLNLQTMTMMMLMTKVKVKVVSGTKPKRKWKWWIPIILLTDWYLPNNQSIHKTSVYLQVIAVLLFHIEKEAGMFIQVLVVIPEIIITCWKLMYKWWNPVSQ